MFLFKILELEVLSFYLSGMPAGGSGTRDSTDGLWGNSIKMFSTGRQKGRGGRRVSGLSAKILDHKAVGSFDRL